MTDTPHLTPHAPRVTLGVIVVSWNVRELLRKCLVSLLEDVAHTSVTSHILVVDSASSDDTPAMLRQSFPQVELIACVENVGYVLGNNLGLAQFGFNDGRPFDRLRVDDELAPSAVRRPPSYVWLLNPDTEIRLGATRTLLDFMQRHPRCGLCGPKLLNPDGSLQHGAFAFPGLIQLALETQPFLWRFRGTRLDGRYTPEQYDADVPFQIGHPLGAAMLARAEAAAQVGMLDPGYEMYAEEVDWAMRMKRAGWERWCVPAAEVVHYGGASSGQASERTERTKWRSRQHYYTRHYSPLKRWVAMRLVPSMYRSRL